MLKPGILSLHGSPNPCSCDGLLKAAATLLFLLALSQLTLGRAPEDFPVLETLVTSGTPIEGREEVIRNVWQAQVNTRGTVAFFASYGLQGGDDGPSHGLFVLEGGEARLIAGPAFSSEFPFFDINDRGTIAAVGSAAVHRFRAGESTILARRGDPAPGTGAQFQEFQFIRDRFLDESDNVLFWADLSDSRRAIFFHNGTETQLVAAEGDPIPDRAGIRYESLRLSEQYPLVAGGRVIFQSFVDSLHLWAGGEVRTLFFGDQATPSGAQLDFVQNYDLNEAGVVAAGVRTSSPLRGELYLWSGGLFREVVGPSAEIPGLPRPATDFGTIFLDRNSALLFSARADGFGGLFVSRREGKVSAVVVNGDQIPSGERIVLTLDPPPPHTYYLPEPLLPVMRPVDISAFVFDARLFPGGKHLTLYNRAEGIENLPQVALGELIQSAGQLLDRISYVAMDEQGRVYLTGNFCCGSPTSSLLRADLGAQSQQGLPFLASSGGSNTGLTYETLVDLLNPAALPATTNLALYWPGGESLVDGLSIVLPARGAARFRAGELGGSAVGHGELSIPSIRGVEAQARFQIRRNQALVTQSAIPSAAPAREHRFLIDNSSGGVSSVGVTNPSDAPLEVELLLADEQGRVVAEASRTLSPRALLAERLDRLFPQDHWSDFLGQLTVRTDSPALAVGFRQTGLQLSFLSNLPPPEPPRAWGLTSLIPQPSTDASYSFFQDVRLSGGDLAALDFSGQLWVLRNGRVFEVIRSSAPRRYLSPRILDFGRDGELIFLARRATDNREEMVRWLDGEFQTLFTAGETVTGVNVFFPGLAEAIDYVPAATVIGREDLIVLAGGTGRRILRGTDPLPDGSGDNWGLVVDVDVNVHGDFAFLSESVNGPTRGAAVGLYREGEVRLLAKLGQPLGPGLPVPTIFTRLHLTDSGEIFLGAGWDEGGSSETGLFIYSENAWKAGLRSGQPAPGLPGLTVRDVVISSFQVNGSGVAAVLAGLSPALGQAFEGVGGAFFAVSAVGEPRLLAVDRTYSAASDFQIYRNLDDFSWNDSGWLVFTSTRSDLLRTLDGAPVERLMTDNRSPASRYSRGPALIGQFIRVFGVDPEGLPYIDAKVWGDGSGGLFAVLPNNPQRLLFPHLVSGQFQAYEYATLLILHNSGPVSTRATVEFFDQAGMVQSRQELLLEAGRTETVSLEPAEPFVGWARVDATGGPLDAVARLELRRNGRSTGEVSIPGQPPTRSGILLAENGDRLFTGIAVANPYARRLEVSFQMQLPDSDEVQTAVIELAPGEQRAILFSQLFDLSRSAIERQLIRFESPYPVPVIALAIEESVLTSIPIAQ